MALHKKTFQTRTLTAIVFAIVMLAGLFINAWTFIALVFIILIGCLYEFNKILKKIYNQSHLTYLPLALLYIVLPLYLLLDLGINIESQSSGNTFSKVDFSPLLPCAIIFSIWINDTMAYIVGSLIGKNSLSKISPNKTWEGTIGGALLCVICITLLSMVIPAAAPISWQHWLHISAISAIAGTFGDLLESKLKRTAGIKDSGSFMPGHGGFLDRFDSLLVATPFVWLYVYLFV